MPTPLTPSSSQEIIPISPPPGSSSSTITKIRKITHNINASSSSTKTKLSSSSRVATSSSRLIKKSSSSSSSEGIEAIPTPPTQDAKPSLASILHRKPRPRPPRQHVAAFNYSQNKLSVSNSAPIDIKGKRKASEDQEGDVGRDGDDARVAKLSRARETEIMMNSLGKDGNPITNSDLYSRTDHFVSCATGHQQSNRGGGSAGAMTYWQVRTAQMDQQAREKQSDLLKGCLFYINGTTGPKLSNIQLRNLITMNGGRFTPVRTASCTHIIANGGLSGSKSQKHIDGQGGRGASRRAKVVKIEWVIDSVEKGVRLSEAGYSVIEDPSQPNLFKTLGVKPKLESEVRADKS
ncbi:hypothetical protein CI109_100504 [Kwoniella shandongensis]|uniref:Uncharacterized protein n=1 Tax=Kwoniella shandongensis TaxID=1734106 RepID=A0A5M6C3R6_9TREE|nr:uncharacterized protein CI109_001653 [Kwoniella shandongensis]KAA5529714.1 hypothetical protein CI109_001653 [Kwoniella shandongensis]